MTRLLIAFVLALSACALSACARLPTDLPPRPTLRNPDTATTLALLAVESGKTGAASAPEYGWTSFGLSELNRLISRALKDRPDLAAAQARITLADQAEHLARLQTQASYSSDATLAREHLSQNGLFPPPIGGSTLTQTDLSLSVGYKLDGWDKNRSLVRAAADDARAARAETAAVRLTLAAAVADAYFSWGHVRASLATNRELQARHRDENRLLKARFDLGLDAAPPRIESEIILALDEDKIRALEYLDRSGRYRLSALIGSDPDHADDLPAPRLDGHLADLPVTLPLDWLGQRPDVAALRDRVEAASDLAQAARADFYPNIDLRMAVGLETLDLSRLLQAGSLSSSIGPAVHLPLFNVSTLTVRLKQREAEYAAAVAAYNRAVLDAAREVADAYALLGNLAQRAQAQARATEEAHKVLTLSRRRHELGLATPLDALVAEAALLQRQDNEADIHATRLRASVSLFKALGAPIKE